MEIIYTDSAKRQLELFKERQVERIEKLIVNDKKYPGVESIEISGADIQKYAKYFTIDKQYYNKKKKYSLFFVTYIYLIIGLGFIIWGLYNDKIIEMIASKPNDITFVIAGCLTSLFSVFMIMYILYVNTRYKDKNDNLIHEDNIVVNKIVKQMVESEMELKRRMEEYDMKVKSLEEYIMTKKGKQDKV